MNTNTEILNVPHGEDVRTHTLQALDTKSDTHEVNTQITSIAEQKVVTSVYTCCAHLMIHHGYCILLSRQFLKNYIQKTRTCESLQSCAFSFCVEQPFL